jgi:hypothetical protein
VLEHLSLHDLRTALDNTFRMLAPNGVFRLVVPDLLERARRYVTDAERGAEDAAGQFMRSTCLGHERRPRTIIRHLRQALGGSIHLWMWDAKSMSAELARAGFVDIRRCDFGDAADPMFARVEHQSRLFGEGLGIAECAMEARKPDWRSSIATVAARPAY